MNSQIIFLHEFSLKPLYKTCLLLSYIIDAEYRRNKKVHNKLIFVGFARITAKFLPTYLVIDEW